MTVTVWKLDASDGQLLVKTGVAGRVAKMGHRLTIAMNTWRPRCNGPVANLSAWT